MLSSLIFFEKPKNKVDKIERIHINVYQPIIVHV